VKTGKFSVDNSVLVNILMVTLLVLGAFSVTRLPREQFAEVPFFWANIVVPYSGASAEDVEKSVTIKIENAFQGLKKVKQISSVSQEGLALVRVEFEDGISNSEFARLFQEVQTRVGNVDLPEGTLDPDIDDFSSSDFLPVIEVVVSGSAEFSLLDRTARLLRERLLTVEGVSGIDLVGARDTRIAVSARQERLESLGISLDELVTAVRRRSVDVPGGTLQGMSREYLLRTLGELEEIREFERLIVRSSSSSSSSSEAGGGVVRLGEVAEVREEYDPDAVQVRFNGKQAVLLRIEKVTRGNSFAVIDGVKKEIDGFSATLPEGLELTLFNDSTVQIRDSLSVLITNALLGFLLLVVLLYLFIGFRNAFMTALGIPVAFAITFIVLELSGETLNGNSLFALVLVLGLIVDHAIVIVENSYRLRQDGLSRREAAIRGADEVVVPVIAATLTTVAAFLPLMILPGILGKFLRVIPLVVAIALLASTGEAILFLPAHFAEWSSPVLKSRQALSFRRFRARFEVWIAALYRRRLLTVGVMFLLMLVSFFLVTRLQQDLFSGEDRTLFYIDIEMAPGTSQERTNQVVRRFEELILSQISTGEISAVNAAVGFSSGSDQNRLEANVAQIIVDVAEPGEGLERPLEAVMNDIKQLCDAIPGPESVLYRKEQGGPPVDPPISFRLFGDNYQDMIRIAADLKQRLASYPELFNIQDNLESGKPELRVRVDQERAARYGLSTAYVGAYLRARTAGVTAATIFRENEELDVLVRFDTPEELSVESLLRMKIPTPDGRQIPFSSLADLEEGRSIAAVKRVEGKREVTVTAEAYAKDNIRAINAEFERLYAEQYQPLYPGISFTARGEFAEFSNLLIQILRLFLVGVFLIYLILGTQFKSYIQPILIMFSVPFAFVGVIWYLVISGTPFSTTVLYAGVALAGIAVNDSIVLISFINSLRREGKAVGEAVVQAASTRLRPILLTSLTTIAGLTPTALGLGGKSPVWSPMASTIIFGLLFSTLTALVLIPCLYGLLADRKRPRRSTPAP
jgi:multidrug efflux pump subunit AcrB